MDRNNHLSTLLVEILIAVLFFAMAATVLLEAFVVSRRQSAYAGLCGEALCAAQNLADQIYASEDAQALLTQAGFAQEKGVYTQENGNFTLAVTLGERQTQAGALREAEVLALRGDEMLIRLPCSRYVPGEAIP